MDGLRPDLVPLALQASVEDVLPGLGDAGGDDPEAAVAGVALQEGRLVRRAEEDAVAGPLLGALGVGRTVLVHLAGEELLDALELGPLQGAELAELEEPGGLQQLHRVLPLEGVQGVGEPPPAEGVQQGGLADALRAGEHEHVVVLAPRLVDAGHGGGQLLACHRPGEWGVRRAEVVHHDRVEPLHPVPLEGVEVVLHWVEGVAGVDHADGVPDLVAGHDAVGVLLQEHPEVGVVGVGPRTPLPLPGQLSLDEVVVRELVLHQLSLQPGVVLHDQDDVARGRLGLAVLADLQLLHPLVAPFVRLAEVLGGGGPPSGEQRLHLDPAVLRGELHHGGVAGEARGVLGALALVPVSVEVDPDEVEGVQQLPARRIRLVVGVGELVLVAHEAAGDRPAAVRVAALLGRPDVLVGEEGVDGLLDGVGAAEGSDDAALGTRVLLLLDVPGDALLLPGRHGPLRGVAPVGVAGEDLVGVEDRSVLEAEDVLPVLGGGRPVEQARQLEGGVVEEVDAEGGGDLPAEGLVLLRRDLPCEGDHQAVARLLRGVLVGGVEHGGAGELHGEVVPEVLRAVVDVEGGEGLELGHAVLPFPSLEVAAHEAADVLALGLLVPGHGGVLGHGLRGPVSLGALVHQRGPGHPLVGPASGHPRRGGRDLQLYIIYDLHFLARSSVQ